MLRKAPAFPAGIVPVVGSFAWQLGLPCFLTWPLLPANAAVLKETKFTLLQVQQQLMG